MWLLTRVTHFVTYTVSLICSVIIKNVNIDKSLLSPTIFFHFLFSIYYLYCSVWFMRNVNYYFFGQTCEGLYFQITVSEWLFGSVDTCSVILVLLQILLELNFLNYLKIISRVAMIALHLRIVRRKWSRASWIITS